MEMSDKLLSRQKQKREGEGRFWWQVYYAIEVARGANNWEKELSQHFGKWQIFVPHRRVSLCHSSRWNNSFRHLTSIAQIMPMLNIWLEVQRKINLCGKTRTKAHKRRNGEWPVAVKFMWHYHEFRNIINVATVQDSQNTKSLWSFS